MLGEPLWRGEDDPEDVEGDEAGLVVGVFEAEPLWPGIVGMLVAEPEGPLLELDLPD